MTIIKRYSNRKLYDTESRQYITLDEIGDMIQQGNEITVVDHSTGSDLTALTMAQIIFEQEKKIGGMLPEAIMTRLIRAGGNKLNTLRGALLAFLEPNAFVEDEIQRRLTLLAKDGKLSDKEKQQLTESLLDKRFRQIEKLEPASSDPSQSEEQKQLQSLLRQLESHVEEMEREVDRLLKAKK
jgi:polyhydroxyalkanoate synthesis repressor PhaR